MIQLQTGIEDEIRDKFQYYEKLKSELDGRQEKLDRQNQEIETRENKVSTLQNALELAQVDFDQRKALMYKNLDLFNAKQRGLNALETELK